MSDSRYSFLLFIITEKLIELISKENKITPSKAMELLYNSQTYAFLENRENCLWHFSRLFIFMVFMHEQKTGKFEIPDVVL